MKLALKNLCSCLIVYISNSFTEKALSLAKSKGVIAITFHSVFGRRNTIAAEKLANLLHDQEKNEIQSSQINKLTKEVKERNSITQNLTGPLYEYISDDIKKNH